MRDLTSEELTTTYDPDVIYKALRPVPDFDGNPNILTRFITICDQIVATYLSNEPGSNLPNLCLLNGRGDRGKTKLGARREMCLCK